MLCIIVCTSNLWGHNSIVMYNNSECTEKLLSVHSLVVKMVTTDPPKLCHETDFFSLT